MKRLITIAVIKIDLEFVKRKMKFCIKRHSSTNQVCMQSNRNSRKIYVRKRSNVILSMLRLMK